MRISDWSSDVCSSDLRHRRLAGPRRQYGADHRLRPPARPRPGAGAGDGRRLRQTVSVESEEAGLTLSPSPPLRQIGRASCRERVCQYVSISVVPVSFKKKTAATKLSPPHHL